MGWFYYEGCVSQNVYLYLSLAFAVIFILALIGALSFVLKPKCDYVAIFKKYRTIAAVVLSITFVLVFVINNTILWWYCSRPLPGFMPYVLWLIILPGVNIVLFYLATYFVYKSMENAVRKMANL